VITVEGAFHGRTLAGIAAAKTEKLVKGFGPMAEGFDQVAFGNLNELRAAITDETAGICVEPVLGEGGIMPASLEYLRALRAVCDEFGLLLMFDEIQVGYGRSGKLFAHQWANIVPDVICIAKGMGGGFPIGAFGATEHAAQGMVPGTHGSTYGGNPLGCAVGNAVLDVLLGDGFLEGVDRTARALWGELLALQARYPGEIETVRGAGLMLGVKTTRPHIDVVNALREHDILTVPAGDNVVRLLPPLIIGSAEIATLINAFDQIFAAPSAV
jgi:acetylornithine/N-succinyldiaminopimelate aminotransferase